MVYFASWADFQHAAENLYTQSPINTRYTVKWRAVDGKLVLKITDNVTCLKFKTSHSVFLNRFEALNLSLMQKMQNRRFRVSAPAVVEAAAPAERQGTPMDVDSSAPAAQSGQAAAGGGGAKKKKPKKKK